MLKEAKRAGYIKIGEVEFGQYKIQIITIEQLMSNQLRYCSFTGCPIEMENPVRVLCKGLAPDL